MTKLIQHWRLNMNERRSSFFQSNGLHEMEETLGLEPNRPRVAPFRFTQYASDEVASLFYDEASVSVK